MSLGRRRPEAVLLVGRGGQSVANSTQRREEGGVLAEIKQSGLVSRRTGVDSAAGDPYVSIDVPDSDMDGDDDVLHADEVDVVDAPDAVV